MTEEELRAELDRIKEDLIELAVDQQEKHWEIVDTLNGLAMLIAESQQSESRRIGSLWNVFQGLSEELTNLRGLVAKRLSVVVAGQKSATETTGELAERQLDMRIDGLMELLGIDAVAEKAGWLHTKVDLVLASQPEINVRLGQIERQQNQILQLLTLLLAMPTSPTATSVN